MKILVALDLSESSSVIIDYVKDLGSLFPENICLLHVAEPDPDFVGYDVDPILMRDQTANKYHKEHKQLQQLRRELSASGTNCTSLLIQGSIVETILNEAVKLSINMIIVGSHRKNPQHLRFWVVRARAFFINPRFRFLLFLYEGEFKEFLSNSA